MRKDIPLSNLAGVSILHHMYQHQLHNVCASRLIHALGTSIADWRVWIYAGRFFAHIRMIKDPYARGASSAVAAYYAAQGWDV